MIPGLIVLLLSQKEYPVIFLQVDDTAVRVADRLGFLLGAIIMYVRTVPFDVAYRCRCGYLLLK